MRINNQPPKPPAADGKECETYTHAQSVVDMSCVVYNCGYVRMFGYVYYHWNTHGPLLIHSARCADYRMVSSTQSLAHKGRQFTTSLQNTHKHVLAAHVLYHFEYIHINIENVYLKIYIIPSFPSGDGCCVACKLSVQCVWWAVLPHSYIPHYTLSLPQTNFPFN